VCVTTYAPAHVVVDVVGYFATGAAFVPVTPARVGDTRDGTGGLALTPLLPGQVLAVPVAGRAGVPAAGTNAVALNVTAANTTAPGYLTVYPCDGAVPYASSVNYVAGQAGAPDAVITGLGAGDGSAWPLTPRSTSSWTSPGTSPAARRPRRIQPHRCSAPQALGPVDTVGTPAANGGETAGVGLVLCRCAGQWSSACRREGTESVFGDLVGAHHDDPGGEQRHQQGHQVDCRSRGTHGDREKPKVTAPVNCLHDIDTATA
jgi:hypothetical protein